MILTQEKIIEQIKKKCILISPLNLTAIGPASIDLTLDTKIRVFKGKKSIITLNEDIDYKKHTKLIDISKGYTLKPGELVMGITKEKITLPSNISGSLQSRSRFARVGLMSHITAPFIAPGVSNKQVLEIYNAGKHPLKLIPGVRICQLILNWCDGNAKYQGTFKEQDIT